MKAHALGGGEATLAIARVTWTRALRTRATIGAACVAALPIALALVLHATHHDDRQGVYESATAAVAVIVGLVIASPIGEEFEERTMTYLWSRPLPRWTVIAGKLVALGPLAAALYAGGITIAMAVMRGGGGSSGGAPATVALAGVAGVCAMAALAAAMATLVPKQALALTIAYLFFVDLPIGVIPARLQVVSIAFNQAELAGFHHEESTATAVVALVVLTASWLAVALWRVRRLE